jgi:organic hydroperoxide reductase OsmC/OhrA
MGADDTLYTAEVGNEDGTAGHVRIAGTSAADILPTGGPAEGAAGYNPEQFLAMAWSTCLGETLKVVIREAGLEHRCTGTPWAGTVSSPGRWSGSTGPMPSVPRNSSR